MKKLLQIWVIVTLVIMGLTACVKISETHDEESRISTVDNQVWSVRIDAAYGEGQTKALSLVTGGIQATWIANDKVYVITQFGLDVSHKGELTAESSGTHTTFSGTLEGTFAVDDLLYLYYPAVGSDFRNQKGTLNYISAHCDQAVAQVKVLSVDTDNHILTTESANFENQVSIWKLTFNSGETPVPVRRLDLFSNTSSFREMEGSNVVFLSNKLSVVLDTPSTEVFVAFKLHSWGINDFSFVIYDDEGNYYDGSKTPGKALEAGKYYKSTISVTKHEQIQVSTPEQLVALSETVNAPGSYALNNLPYYNVILTADIDCSGISDFTPIGYGQGSSTPIFNGIFDGNGHKIQNLTINKPDQDGVGLLGQFTGIVRNLTLENCFITGKISTGGIVGYAAGNPSYYPTPVIENCSFSGGTVSGLRNVGGIVGSTSFHHQISQCTFNGTCEGNKTTGNTDSFIGVGGIVGYNGAPRRTSFIDQCTVSGSINSYSSANNKTRAGGIVGIYEQAEDGAVIQGCVNHSNVTGQNGWAGGIIGGAPTNYGLVHNCTNDGPLTGTTTGNIVGWHSKFNSSGEDHFSVVND